jgi:GTP-binding protein EngB required for normal cell division
MVTRRQPRRKGQWIRLIESLAEREILVGLFLIIDISGALRDQDEQLVEWAGAAGWQVHLLLTKSDKLNQRESRRA